MCWFEQQWHRQQSTVPHNTAAPLAHTMITNRDIKIASFVFHRPSMTSHLVSSHTGGSLTPPPDSCMYKAISLYEVCVLVLPPISNDANQNLSPFFKYSRRSFFCVPGSVVLRRLPPTHPQHARCLRAATENVRPGFFSRESPFGAVQVLDIYKVRVDGCLGRVRGAGGKGEYFRYLIIGIPHMTMQAASKQVW